LRGGLRWRVDGAGDNYADAALAVGNYLENRNEVDIERIGAFGISQGSYWVPRMAAKEKRLKACAMMMGSFYEQGFDAGQPTFKETLMYLTGCESEEEVDELIPYITLAGVEQELEASLLILIGEFDELAPAQDAQMFMNRAIKADKKDLVIFENE